jgi:hypothetical protein
LAAALAVGQKAALALLVAIGAPDFTKLILVSLTEFASLASLFTTTVKPVILIFAGSLGKVNPVTIKRAELAPPLFMGRAVLGKLLSHERPFPVDVAIVPVAVEVFARTAKANITPRESVKMNFILCDF